MGFYQVAVIYNKTQHTNNTPRSIKTQHTETTQAIKDTLHTMNTMQILIFYKKNKQLQLNKLIKNKYAIH
jgi:hypothetical protein